MATLTIEHVSRSFGATRVLEDVSLDIRDGEFLTLVGPSGCGKTTLLRIVAGLEHADAGSVRIDGASVDALAPKRRDVAMVFQSYALYPYMTVEQNIALPLTMRRLSRAQRLPWIGRWWPGARAIRAGIHADVADLAGTLGLGTLLQRRPAQLSGGQRQRVALGRAMVRRPKVFLMDEPLSNLDAKLRTQTRAEIAELHRTLGATFVYVTHDQVEAMTMSDRVALMHDGRILQVGAPQSIYDDPQDLRVAEFIGTPKINVLAAAPGERGLRVQGLEWPLAAAAAAGPVSVAVRPEWWTLHLGPSPADGRHCVVTGRVRHLEALGSETLVHVQADSCAEPLVARVTPAQAAALTVGLGVTLAAPVDRVLLFDGDGRRIAARPTVPLREALVG